MIDPLPSDPQQAKHLLDEAGWRDMPCESSSEKDKSNKIN